MKSFRNQVAAITGAASGIGRALAENLAEAGCHLALADTDMAGLEQVCADLAGSGVKISLHQLDVSDEQAVHQYARDAIEAHGSVQMIFNNAGVALNQPASEMNTDDMRWLMGINYWGVVYGTQAFLPHLQAQGFGHIINVSSLFGMIGVPTQAAYNSAKFAVRGFTECLRIELAGSGVGVSCVHPGGIDTNIVRNARMHPDEDREQSVRRFKKLARTTPDRAARIILDGVRRNRVQILVGADAHLISRIGRLFPASYEGVLRLLGMGKAFEDNRKSGETQRLAQMETES
ncbi:SDR family NAD(P)-dependent oxidoreductase [Biformimicrobium ophioploci]|uniref:SDR family NAD(P)-dependent oxidoreductase n=1 Tax=Biformimicrobium ophioploci TaxID=3036711 RepID=A0ABQ6LWM0_9GAMM|nr:SDR family oxidoreductase [Microbulbifer sp. NKW57]GMG86477.1 SDR family NAD(P)-dependent oxidoreductase [Microbulbifer sp. NKW57]